MENNLISSYGYRGRGPAGIGAIDWNALLQGLLNAGVSIYTAQAQIDAAKRAAAAAAAAGNPYYLPPELAGYAGGGGYQGASPSYMPYLIAGVALVALLFIMKK